LILFVLYLLGTAAMADAAEGALLAVAKLDGGGQLYRCVEKSISKVVSWVRCGHMRSM
jgi:hypothetical protein